MQKKIFIISNSAWYIYNFRLTLMKTLRSSGYLPIAAAPADEYAPRITAEGFTFLPVGMNRKGKNPFEDLHLLFRLWRIFRRERPDIILTYTPKPNIYASLAAFLLKIPVINNVAGLGTVFGRRGILSAIVSQLYRAAFSRSCRIFFQNNDDLKLFVDKGLVNRSAAERIPGSGVDVGKFVPQACRDPKKDRFVFLLAARLLWNKGVGEYVEAARLLKKRYPHVSCHLAGFIDASNPQGIPLRQVRSWAEEGAIRYDGASDNIIEVMAGADCVVLPSFYREGVPRVLLEAASMAKPVITTDGVGCRDAVESGVTGYVCRGKDVRDLADKMERMLLLSDKERESMGARGREKMVREFDERFVIQRYLEVIESIEGARNGYAPAGISEQAGLAH